MKFKVGDRVKIVGSVLHNSMDKAVPEEDFGKIITIKTIEKDSKYPYRADPEVTKKQGIQECQYAELEISHIAVKATKLAKRMYPNIEEKDGYLYV